MYDMSIAIILGFVASFLGISAQVIGVNEIVKHGRLQGYMVGLGVVFCQFLWSMVTVLGVYWIVGIGSSNSHQFPEFNLIAALVILWIAYKIFRSDPEAEMKAVEQGSKPQGSKMLKNFSAGFLLSAVAPQRIILYVAVLGGFNIHVSMASLHTTGLEVVLGITLGVALWWLIFVQVIGVIRERMTPRHLHYFNYVGASILLLMGLASLIPVVMYLL